MRLFLALAAVLLCAASSFGQYPNGQCAVPSSSGSFHPIGNRIAGAFMSGEAAPVKRAHAFPHPVRRVIAAVRARR